MQVTSQPHSDATSTISSAMNAMTTVDKLDKKLEGGCNRLGDPLVSKLLEGNREAVEGQLLSDATSACSSAMNAMVTCNKKSQLTNAKGQNQTHSDAASTPPSAMKAMVKSPIDILVGKRVVWKEGAS